MARPRQHIACGDFVLRRWRGQADFAPAFRLIEESLDHLRPWEPWAAGHSEESTRSFLAKTGAQWASGDVYNYAIAKNGTLIGMCQTYRGPEPQGRRMGYWLHPDATGQGIATRATTALVTEMFALPDVAYVESRTTWPTRPAPPYRAVWASPRSGGNGRRRRWLPRQRHPRGLAVEPPRVRVRRLIHRRSGPR